MSEERGRQPVVSTGRGGAGNLIRSPSRGVDPDVHPGMELGREISRAREQSVDRLIHSGRGGAGNIRSPSRNPTDRITEEREEALTDKLVAESRGRATNAPISTGRGGVGNISDSRSRSRSAVRGGRSGTPSVTNANGDVESGLGREVRGGERFVSGGRGGFGNITEEQRERNSLQEEKEEERRKYEEGILARHKVEGTDKPIMTGKGGAGNLAHNSHTNPIDLASLSLEEREAHAKLHARDTEARSTGRGGGGNMHHHSPLSAEGERGRHADANDNANGKGGMLGNVFRSLSRARGGKD